MSTIQTTRKAEIRRARRENRVREEAEAEVKGEVEEKARRNLQQWKKHLKHYPKKLALFQLMSLQTIFYQRI